MLFIISDQNAVIIPKSDHINVFIFFRIMKSKNSVIFRACTEPFNNFFYFRI